ncbi:MAG: phosphoglycerate kinase [Firmicutes bacterium]|nr:phosphoglycerate kinase [Bacillota bacterium]
MRLLQDLEVSGKRVLVRVDFNVPLVDGKIEDDYRLLTAFPTINYLLEKSARVILISHLGRPDGRVVDKLRLAPVARRVEELLDKPIKYVDDCIGPMVQDAVSALKPGEVLLLENLRFYPGEEKNDEGFAKQLASIADCFVNDAFSAAHRAHASTFALAHLLPSAAGFLMQKEVDSLSGIIAKPQPPFMVVLGGSKVSDKIGVIDNLIDRADRLLIGGGMAFTFLKAQGKEVGKSLVENDRLEYAASLLKRAGDKIILPLDVIAAPQLSADAPTITVGVDSIPFDQMGLDIGPLTIEKFVVELSSANSIFWNGPLGAFETPAFSRGTYSIRDAIAKNPGTTVIGGGDTAAAVSDCLDLYTHVSTGGGASLEFLEGRKLPGVTALL